MVFNAIFLAGYESDEIESLLHAYTLVQWTFSKWLPKITDFGSNFDIFAFRVHHGSWKNDLIPENKCLDHLIINLSIKWLVTWLCWDITPKNLYFRRPFWKMPLNQRKDISDTKNNARFVIRGKNGIRWHPSKKKYLYLPTPSISESFEKLTITECLRQYEYPGRNKGQGVGFWEVGALYVQKLWLIEGGGLRLKKCSCISEW